MKEKMVVWQHTMQYAGQLLVTVKILKEFKN